VLDEFILSQRFGEYVGRVIFTTDVSNGDISHFDSLPYEEMRNVDVFGSLVKFRVFGQL